ncbi:Imm1 family immunity protein [Streptomyces sp. NPDC002685]|uniref:Imm1 family immunity protein n=1 Tax=Streptomyces sp. NPDC002685 TaxID=3154540 RepID=UPI00332FB764
MILNAYIDHRRLELTSWQATERVITTLVEPKPNWPYSNTTAEFTFAHRRQKTAAAAPHFDSYLHAAVNARTGYGALKWCLTQDSAIVMDAAIADRVWLSDNPAPPDLDPDVIADPGFPLSHHPRSTLPITRARAAVEEYCRTGTGHRPTCIDWTPGDLAGRRLDMPIERDFSNYCEDPWCEIPEPKHPTHY